MRARVQPILEVADRYGADYTVTSARRSPAEQEFLWLDCETNTQPGCSQHQYGLAIDVAFRDPQWQAWYQRAGQHMGLVTVSRDPVHLQAFPGNLLRPHLVRGGLCPTPGFDPGQCRSCFADCPSRIFARAQQFVSNVFRRGTRF